MKFDVSSTALLSCLQSISKVIASKNSLPILDSFLFNLEGNTLTVTASDAETRLVTSVEVMNVQGAGLFAISAKILLDPLKELPEQTRLIFVKSRFENKTNREIAEELDTHIKTIEYHIAKALKLFRVRLKDYLPLLAFLGLSLY